MNLWIVSSMAEELDLLLEATDARLKGHVGGCPWFACQAGPHAVTLGVTGVGIASACTMLGAFCGMVRPDLMVMVGSAGSLPGSGLRVGDMVVAETEILAELGVVSGPGMGDARKMKLPGIIREIPMDRSLSYRLFHVAKDTGKAVYGRSLTVVGNSANDDHARDRAMQFHALAENMEGYAAAFAGNSFGFRAAEIRGISNRAGDRDKSRWDFKKAMVPPQKAILEYIRTTN